MECYKCANPYSVERKIYLVVKKKMQDVLHRFMWLLENGVA